MLSTISPNVSISNKYQISTDSHRLNSEKEQLKMGKFFYISLLTMLSLVNKSASDNGFEFAGLQNGKIDVSAAMYLNRPACKTS